MKPTDMKIVQILQHIRQQYGADAADYLETQAAECAGRDEAKRSLFLKLHSALTHST